MAPPKKSPARTRGPAARGWNPLTLALLTGVWVATLPNWPLWRALANLPEMASTRGALFIAGFGVMVALLTTVLLALFAWRFTIKPAIVVFLLAAAFGAHFMGSYGVVIDATMMNNVVQTDTREVRDLLNWHMLASVLLLAGLPLFLVARVRLARLGAWRQLGRNLLTIAAALALLLALVFALFADLSATMRNHKSLRYLINPANSFYALGLLAHGSNARPAGPPLPIGLDAHIPARPLGARAPLLVLAIGETARADHFELNGYARATNPELAKLGVLSFRNVSSCGTNTAASLPCMFSALGKRDFETRERDHENLLDLVQRAGMAVLWLDNQGGCKGLCERVPHAFANEPVAGVPPPPAAQCQGGDCFDAALLHGLDARLAALPAPARARGVLIVLHQIGSHGPAYYKRSPPERKPFLPECTTNVLQQCEHAALINAYDNSIAYTDHVLALTVQWLQQQSAHHDPMLLYVSDHGESLGENNLYLHGLPYAVAPVEQTHVPMLLWLPEQARAAERFRPGCLDGLRDAQLSHDNLFHTVLGLLGIRASEYQASLDAFSSCRKP